jgi:putative drug exporter of the RND superfamily
MTLRPALMSMLGDRVWWMPVRLDRPLPHLDVEGSAPVDKQLAPRRVVDDERGDALV